MKNNEPLTWDLGQTGAMQNWGFVLRTGVRIVSTGFRPDNTPNTKPRIVGGYLKKRYYNSST